MSPMKQFTTLDTHDGIGVVDAKDILTDDEIEYASNELYKVGANVKRKYSSAEYHNLDIYQINSTYYSALGDNDDAYLPGNPSLCSWYPNDLLRWFACRLKRPWITRKD